MPSTNYIDIVSGETGVNGRTTDSGMTTQKHDASHSSEGIT